MRKRITIVIVAIGAVLAITATAAVADFSFGVFRDQQLSNFSFPLFGVGHPLANSSTQQVSQSDAQADPLKLVTLASGLTAKVVTTQGPAVDGPDLALAERMEPDLPDRLQRAGHVGPWSGADRTGHGHRVPPS